MIRKLSISQSFSKLMALDYLITTSLTPNFNAKFGKISEICKKYTSVPLYFSQIATNSFLYDK